MAKLFLDNDVVSKLASCDLLDQALEWLGVGCSSVLVLSTLKHKFGITRDAVRSKVIRKIGKEAFDRIATFQKKVGEAPAVSAVSLDLFSDVVGIDGGEAILFAAASEGKSSTLVTGDKRSIRCLAFTDSLKEIVRELSGRVFCFEQIIKGVIATAGFDDVKEKIVPAYNCDTALRAAFGSGIESEEKQVIRTLDSYINELRSQTGDLLAE